jgi:RNA exonuclease 4
MSGLKLEQLSSNWKKLQEQLQAEKKQNNSQQSNGNGVKRKRTDDKQKPTNGYKKPKTTPNRAVKASVSHKMGISSSKPSTSSHTDHDSPKSAISTPTTQHHDEVNIGIHPTHKAGKFLALDCEMVGTGAPPYPDHVLARASLVNFHGELIYDSYVLPPPGIEVKDYRTFVSGITPANLQPGVARPFGEVQKMVAGLLEGKVLVGHALKNDLLVLELKHPRRDLRDTSRYPKFRVESRGKPPALRNLAKAELGWEIQVGEHSSVEDARAAMALFRKERAGFEEENRRVFGDKPRGGRREASKQVNGMEPDEDGEDEDENEDEYDVLDDEEVDSEEEPTKKAAVVAVKKRRKKKNRTKRK